MFGIWGFGLAFTRPGCRVEGLELWVWRLGLRVAKVERVSGFGFPIEGLGFSVGAWLPRS